MIDEPETWTIEHFGQANPAGPAQDDVPALLRRVADTIEKLGVVQVQDIVFHTELSNGAEWRPSFTVYVDRGRPTETDSSRPRPRALRTVRGAG